MLAYRITVIVIDHDDVGQTQAGGMIEHARYPNRAIDPQVCKIETAEIGEWADAHPLNRYISDAHLDELFQGYLAKTKPVT